MSLARGTALRAGLWLVLGSQVGAWLLFGLVIAPTAFRVLPSTAVAGTLVGPVLTVVHLYGAAAGVALSLLAWGLGRGPLLVALPLLLGAVCLYSHFGVTGEIAELRDLTFGPAGNEQAAARFNELHQRSLLLFVGVGVGALVQVGLHARADELAAAR